MRGKGEGTGDTPRELDLSSSFDFKGSSRLCRVQSRTQGLLSERLARDLSRSPEQSVSVVGWLWSMNLGNAITCKGNKSFPLSVQSNKHLDWI